MTDCFNYFSYQYDGTFEGLLTCIYEAYYRHEVQEHICRGDTVQESLLDCSIQIPTDRRKADKVLESIRVKISKEALRHAFYAYLSELDDIGVWIYRYLRLGWKVGSAVDRHLREEEVWTVQEASRKVEGEANRMLGLLRFRELKGGIYYAPMGPDHNIVSLIAPHFVDRLSDQQWMIHDVKRDIAAVYNTKDWAIAAVRQKQALSPDKDELEFQQLWKQYFQSITIQGRYHPGLQRQFMPKRYWKYLVEKNGQA